MTRLPSGARPPERSSTRAGRRLEDSIIEVLSEGVIVTRLDGALVQANPAARAILEQALDPTAGDRDWWSRLDVRHPDGGPLVLDTPGQMVLATGRDLRDFPVSVRRGDGERRSLRLNHRLLREGDEPAGLVVSFHDVTEEDKVLERLLATEAQLRDAHELAALAIWEWDVRRDRMTVLQGLPGQTTPGDVGMTALLDAIHPEDRERVREHVETCCDASAENRILRYRTRLDDGRVAWVETRMRPVRGPDGAVTSVRGTTQDVTAAHRSAVELEEARDFLQSTMDSLAGHVAVLGNDGEVIAVNAAWVRFARENGGTAAGTGVGSNYLSASAGPLVGDDGRQVATALQSILDGDLERFTLEYACHSPTEERWFVLQADPHRSAGSTRVVVQHTDVTARRRAEADARMRADLLDEVDAAVIATDTSSRVTVWSKGAERLYGWTADEVVGHRLGDFLVGPEEEAVAQQILHTVRAEGEWEGEFTVRRKDGTTFPVHVRDTTLVDADGRMTGLLGVSVDVSERLRSERELRSARDYLHTVTESMGEGMVTLDLEGRVVSMNPVAEAILGWPASEMLGRVFHDVAHFRHADGTPYPLADCPILRTWRDGEAIRSGDEVFVRSDGSDVPVDYSSSPFETPEGVRGTVLLFSDISERKAREARVHHDLEDLEWVARINEAIEQDRLVLYAQPIVDLATGETVQHELLIRMLGRDGCTIAPGQFLPPAERYGLIREIDRWVVRRAAELSAAGHAVELNISAESLGDPDFAMVVERELVSSGADCSRLVIELTETALVRDEEAGRRFIERVQRLGCRLALDDFGTGYGGFTYLKRFDVDYLKIDTEFVRDLPRNAASQHVVRAVVRLAEDFGQKTVAEGVEDSETLELLRELGVDYAQGYHLGRPAPTAEAFTRRGVT